MTIKEVLKIRIFLSEICEKILDINIVLDDLEHDDITMTDEDKTEMKKGMVENAIKIWLVSQELIKELNRKLP